MPDFSTVPSDWAWGPETMRDSCRLRRTSSQSCGLGTSSPDTRGTRLRVGQVADERVETVPPRTAVPSREAAARRGRGVPGAVRRGRVACSVGTLRV